MTEEKAITTIDRALTDFQEETGLAPRVILVPSGLYNQYADERAALETVLGPAVAPGDDENWVDVRVVEHEFIEHIEVY